MPAYLLDVNVLIALAWPQHLHHARARKWWGTIDEWATTPITEAAFVRLSTSNQVVGKAVLVGEALAMLTAIRSAPGHRFLTDDSSLAVPMIDTTRVASSAQITDAHLVNLAVDHGFVLATLDAGISSMLMPADRSHVEVLADSW